MRTRIGSAGIWFTLTAMFLVELARGAIANDAELLRLGALPDSGQIHYQYWRLITFGFLHWDLRHLLLNTLLLFLLGPIVERRAGTVALLIIFLSASVASGAGILVKHQFWPAEGVSLGASGGMFGLLGAGLVLAFRRPSSSRLRTMLMAALVLGLIYSFLPGVSMIGHIVGLIMGATMAFMIPLKEQAPTVAAD
jgi:membrane associated rhomboid family serine protease